LVECEVFHVLDVLEGQGLCPEDDFGPCGEIDGGADGDCACSIEREVERRVYCCVSCDKGANFGVEGEFWCWEVGFNCLFYTMLVLNLRNRTDLFTLPVV